MRAAFREKGMLYLLIGIPVASLLMGAVTLYVAFTYRDDVVVSDQRPLSKTSWREEQVDP